jgi:septation ring formation regulator EzrA
MAMEMTPGREAALKRRIKELQEEYHRIADSTFEAENKVKELQRELAAAQATVKHGNARQVEIRKELEELGTDEWAEVN